MEVITATFSPDMAEAAVQEMLTLGEFPERLAEKLGSAKDADVVAQAVEKSNFKRVLTDVQKIKDYLALMHDIDQVKRGKWAFTFLGAGFKEKQLAKMIEHKKSFGDLMDAPRWFYQHPRVVVLSAIRDYALELSQSNAHWVDIGKEPLRFPIVQMFERGDVAYAKTLVNDIDRPFKDIDPRFILENFEGHRSISFDFTTNVVISYYPAKRG
jgi:hypothetical protein